MNIRDENYIQISGWMINELHLKGNELLLYALIHGFCQDGKSVFKGSLPYVMSWLNITKQTCIATIQSLIEKGLVVKNIIRNKNSVAGCEYYTTRSRMTRGSKLVPREESAIGGQKILPPQTEISAGCGKKIISGWSKNLTRGGQNFLPNNTSCNTKDTAADTNKTDLKKLSEKYFGENAFDASFAEKAAAFLSNQNINNFENYFEFIKSKLNEKQNLSHNNILNPRGFAYRLFFQKDIAQEFSGKQQQLVFNKQKEAEKERKLEESKITCPCCQTSFLSDFYSACPVCGFNISDFKNETKIIIHKRFLQLPKEKQKSYEKELGEIYCVDLAESVRMTESQKLLDMAQKQNLENDLNIKYGLSG